MTGDRPEGGMEFGLLGQLVVRNGEAVLPVPAGKQRAVLAVLLVRTGQVVSIDEMMELIWAGYPPRSARVTLYNHVKRLRQTLGGTGVAPVKTNGAGYFIETTADDLDVTRFKALYAAGSQAVRQHRWVDASSCLYDALSLWRGRPLEDVSCPSLADSEVPHLEALRTEALEFRIDAELHLGRHRAVLPELQRFAQAEPLRESVHALLMLALYRDGRQAEALAAYQNARYLLVSELGLEPGLELRRMHHRILNADPTLELAYS